MHLREAQKARSLNESQVLAPDRNPERRSVVSAFHSLLCRDVGVSPFPWWGRALGSAPHRCSGVPAVWGGGSWRPPGSFTALTEPHELSPHFKARWVLFRLCVHLKVEVHVWLSLSLSSASCAASHSAHLLLHKLTPDPRTSSPSGHPRPPLGSCSLLGPTAGGS